MSPHVKSFQIKQVETDNERKAYFNLRWQLLRKPWRQKKGSEQDEIEDQCYHLIAIDTPHNVIGVARLQFNTDNNKAQVRYMAVDTQYQNQGIGRALIAQLETHAKNLGYKTIVLYARDSAVGFYSKLGYSTVAKSYLLFDEIQHYSMSKKLRNKPV